MRNRKTAILSIIGIIISLCVMCTCIRDIVEYLASYNVGWNIWSHFNNFSNIPNKMQWLLALLFLIVSGCTLVISLLTINMFKKPKHFEDEGLICWFIICVFICGIMGTILGVILSTAPFGLSLGLTLGAIGGLIFGLIEEFIDRPKKDPEEITFHL